MFSYINSKTKQNPVNNLRYMQPRDKVFFMLYNIIEKDHFIHECKAEWHDSLLESDLDSTQCTVIVTYHPMMHMLEIIIKGGNLETVQDDHVQVTACGKTLPQVGFSYLKNRLAVHEEGLEGQYYFDVLVACIYNVHMTSLRDVKLELIKANQA